MTDAPIQHIVLMKFPEELTVEEDAELRAMVAGWPDEIGTMTELRFGADLTGARSRGYHYLLVTTFPDAETLAAYDAHPVHRELIRFLDERGCERLAFDYHLDDSARLV